MSPLLEQQLIDNENRVALMAAIITAGMVAQSPGGDVSGEKLAKQSVGLALMITKEVSVVAKQVRSEL